MLTFPLRHVQRHRLVKGCGKNDQVNGNNTKSGGTTTTTGTTVDNNGTRPTGDYAVGSRTSPMERIGENASDDAAVARSLKQEDTRF